MLQETLHASNFGVVCLISFGHLPRPHAVQMLMTFSEVYSLPLDFL